MTQSAAVERLNPGTLAQPVLNLYSQIAIAPAGPLAFVSGQVAIDEQGRMVGINDHVAQARQCFLNIRHALDALQAHPADIVQMRIHVVNHTPQLIDGVFSVAGRGVFGDDWPLCASTYVGVAALGLPEWLVEIDCVISLGARP